MWLMQQKEKAVTKTMKKEGSAEHVDIMNRLAVKNVFNGCMLSKMIVHFFKLPVYCHIVRSKC